jgi:hypothetical protein
VQKCDCQNAGAGSEHPGANQADQRDVRRIMKNKTIFQMACLTGILIAAWFAIRQKPAELDMSPKPVQKWEYLVQACHDDSLAMREYEMTHPSSKSGLDYSGEFGLLKIQPNGKDEPTDWEMCGCFLEPKKDNPEIILIFKRPVK